MYNFIILFLHEEMTVQKILNQKKLDDLFHPLHNEKDRKK